MARYGIMSRKIKLSQEEMAWLRSNHQSLTLTQLAKRYAVCVDTVKRLLVRLELQHFPGAKYQVKPPPKVWRRPCIMCGCTKSRPKNLYKCHSCSSQLSGEGEYKEVRSKRQPYTPKVMFDG